MPIYPGLFVDCDEADREWARKNGTEAAAPDPVGNPDVIRLLEQLLEGARAGRIVGVGVGIAMADGQWNGLAVGGGLPEVNFGLDAAKAVLLEAARGKQSPIIRPR